MYRQIVQVEKIWISKIFKGAGHGVALALTWLMLNSTAATAAEIADNLPKSDDATMIILDASGSMWGEIGNRIKFDQAREVVENYLTTKNQEQEVGLMVYGHRRAKDCNDIELVIPPGENSEWIIRSKLRSLRPLGKTPLTAAVLQAANDLKYRERKASIILVTDGIETCGLDPCQVASQLRASGVDFKAHVIGFDVDARQRRTLTCLATNTGGTYVDAKDGAELQKAFDRIESELRAENSDLRRQLDDLRIRYSRALLEIEALRAELEDLRERLRIALAERDAFKEELSRSQDLNQRLLNQVSDLEQQLRNREIQVADLIEELAREKEFSAELERSKNQTIGSLQEALRKERDQAARQIDKLTGDVDTLLATIEQMRSDHADERDALSTALADTEIDRDELKEALALLNQENRQKDNDIERLRAELRDQVAAKDDLSNQLANATRLFDETQKRLGDALNDAQNEIERLNANIEKEAAARAAEEENSDNLAKIVREQGDEIERLKRLLATKEEAIAARADEAEKARQLAELAKQRQKAAQDELVDAKDKAKNDIAQLEDNVKERDQQLANMNNQLDESKGELDKLQGLMDETTALMAAALEAFERQRKELEERLAGLAQRNEVLVKEVAGLNAVNDERLRKEKLRRTQFDKVEWIFPEGFPEIDMSDVEWTITSRERTANYRTNGVGEEIRLPQTTGAFRIDVAKDQFKQSFEVTVDDLNVKTHPLVLNAALLLVSVEPEEIAGQPSLVISSKNGVKQYVNIATGDLILASPGNYNLKGLVTNAQTEIDVTLSQSSMQPVLLDFPVGIVQLNVGTDTVSSGDVGPVIRWQLRPTGASGGAAVNGTGGKANITVARGEYRLTVSSDSFSETRIVRVNKGEITEANFQATGSNLTIAIEIPAALASKAQSLTWRLETAAGDIAKTGNNAFQRLTVAPGSYELIVELAGEQVARTVTVDETGQAVVDVELNLSAASISPLNADTSTLIGTPVRWILTRRSDDGGPSQRRRIQPVSGVLELVLKPGRYTINGLAGQSTGFAEFTIDANRNNKINVLFK